MPPNQLPKRKIPSLTHIAENIPTIIPARTLIKKATICPHSGINDGKISPYKITKLIIVEDEKPAMNKVGYGNFEPKKVKKIPRIINKTPNSSTMS